MFKAFIVSIGFLFSCGVKSSKPQQDELTLNKCQKNWTILKVKKQFAAKVLFHATASPPCGVLATGAVTIVEADDGNTYRVIEYCNTDKNFAIGASVVVRPETTNNDIPLIADDKQQCEILKTLFGRVEVSK